MSLGMEIGLDPGDFVLDGDAAPPKMGHSLPNFVPCLLWPNGWMNQDTIWYGGRPWPGRHCVRWGPSYPSKRGTAPPNFRPVSIVAKRLSISATAELLLLNITVWQRYTAVTTFYYFSFI